MKKENKSYISYLFIAALTVLVFWNFFFKGLAPYPGNYMLAWYEPWKSDHTINQTISIVHKAVADDTFRQLFPLRLLGADELKRFELPLWNPYNGSGMPLMATMHSGFLNPFNIFFLIFPAYLAWTLHIITQFILLCFFTYIYCRSISLKQTSSMFATTIFSLSGFVIARLVFGEYVYVLACLPLLLYLIETYVQDQKSKKIFFLPLVVFFSFISGQPQMILYVLITAVLYAIYRIRKFNNLLFFFLQLFFGIGFAAIQLLPTFELYQNANITTGSSKFIFDRFLLPIQHLVTIVIPNYFGNQGTYNYWGAGDYIETIAAVGSIPCFFAFLNLWGKSKEKRSIENFYLVIIPLTIIATIDWFGARLFFSQQIPIFSTGIPSRIFVVTTFSIAILAGIGFQKILNEKIEFKSLFYKSLPFLILLTGIFVATAFLFANNTVCPDTSSNILCRKVALRNTFMEGLVFVLFILIFLSFAKKKIFTKNLQILTILFVVAIGIYNAQKFLPFSAKETFVPENELIKTLQDSTQDGRVFGFGDANIKTDFATLFRFYDPNYYDPLYIKRYGELVAYPESKPLLRSDVEVGQSKNSRLLDLLAVKYFIYKKSDIPLDNNQNIIWQNDKWTVIENENAFPHAFLVNNFEVISDDRKILERLFSESFNPKTTILIEKQVSLKSQKQKTDLKDHVLIKKYQENKIVLESSTSDNQILVLSDNYFPGWKAYIDKKETEIFRANYTFRGIILPKGDHTIIFVYQPNSVKFGIYITLLTGLIYFAFLIYKSVLYKRP
jgi:hypothetical protein